MKKIILHLLFIHIGIIVMAQPPVFLSLTGSTNVSCYAGCDGTASVSAAGGTVPYSYSWNNIPTQTNAIASGLCAGPYTCTVTDANGSTAKTSAMITQATPVVLSSNDASICPNTSTTLSVNGSGGTSPITYSWSPGSLNGSSVSVSPTTNTTYTITGTDANGCTGSASALVTVSCTGIGEKINSKGIVKVFPNPFCDNATFTIQSNKANEECSFELYNVLGKQIKSLNEINRGQFRISREGLPNGIYFYKIYSSESTIGVGKLVIE